MPEAYAPRRQMTTRAGLALWTPAGVLLVAVSLCSGAVLEWSSAKHWGRLVQFSQLILNPRHSQR